MDLLIKVREDLFNMKLILLITILITQIGSAWVGMGLMYLCSPQTIDLCMVQNGQEQYYTAPPSVSMSATQQLWHSEKYSVIAILVFAMVILIFNLLPTRFRNSYCLTLIMYSIFIGGSVCSTVFSIIYINTLSANAPGI